MREGIPIFGLPHYSSFVHVSGSLVSWYLAAWLLSLTQYLMTEFVVPVAVPVAVPVLLSSSYLPCSRVLAGMFFGGNGTHSASPLEQYH